MVRIGSNRKWQEKRNDQTSNQEQDDQTSNQEQDDQTSNQEQDDQTSNQEQDDSSQAFTVDIISNGTDGVAPATFEFEANATGAEPYTYSWNFDDDTNEGTRKTVVHEFEDAGTYNVTLSATDTDDKTVFDSVEITVEDEDDDSTARETQAQEGKRLDSTASRRLNLRAERLDDIPGQDLARHR